MYDICEISEQISAPNQQFLSWFFFIDLPDSQIKKTKSIYSNKLFHNFQIQVYLSPALCKWVSAKTETVS